MEGLDWKALFEKDSSKTIHNSIQQKYFLRDEDFWDHYQKFVDSEIDTVVQIKRDFRRILWRFRDLNRTRKDKNKFPISLEDVVEEFYVKTPRHDVSDLRSIFETKYEYDVLFEKIQGNEEIDERRSLSDMAKEAEELNTVSALNNSELIDDDDAQNATEAIRKLIREIGVNISPEIEEYVFWSDPDQEMDHLISNLNEIEKEIIQDLREKFLFYLKDKKVIDFGGKTIRLVIETKLKELSKFPKLILLEIKNGFENLKSTDLSENEKKTDFLSSLVFQKMNSHINEFSKNYNIELEYENLDQFINLSIKKIRENMKFEKNEHGLILRGKIWEINQSGKDSYRPVEILKNLEEIVGFIRKLMTSEDILESINCNNYRNAQILIEEKISLVFIKKNAKYYDLKKGLIYSIEDESEDLGESFVSKKIHNQLERELEKHNEEEQKMKMKIFVFNFQVNTLKNKNKLKEIQDELQNVKNELKKEKNVLINKENNKKDLDRIKEIDQILMSNSNQSDHILYMKGLGSNKLLNEQKKFLQEFTKRRSMNDKKINSLFEENIFSSKINEEFEKVFNMGLKTYLEKEIGIENYLGRTMYRKILKENHETNSEFNLCKKIVQILLDEQINENSHELSDNSIIKYIPSNFFQLLSIKLKFLRDEVKDIEEMEQTKYFNRVIQAEKEMQQRRDQGYEPSQKELTHLIKKWDLDQKTEKAKIDKMIFRGDTVFNYYMKRKQRQFIEAKARVLIDYLLRFDINFRTMYLRSRSIQKMNQIIDQSTGNKKENKEYLEKLDILELEPENFGNNKKSLMLRVIERGLKEELPEDFLDSHPMLAKQEIKGFIEERLVRLTHDLEERLIYDSIEEKKLNRNRRIDELEYIQNVKEWINKQAVNEINELEEWVKGLDRSGNFILFSNKRK